MVKVYGSEGDVREDSVWVLPTRARLIAIISKENTMKSVLGRDEFLLVDFLDVTLMYLLSRIYCCCHLVMKQYTCEATIVYKSSIHRLG